MTEFSPRPGGSKPGPSSTFGAYSAGYGLAAGVLVDAVLRERTKTEALIFPIGYSYRHALELALKDANYWAGTFVNGSIRAGVVDESEHRTGAQLDQELSGHGLLELLSQLERRLAAVSTEDWLDSSVRAAIAVMHGLDPDGLNRPGFRGDSADWISRGLGGCA